MRNNSFQVQRGEVVARVFEIPELAGAVCALLVSEVLAELPGVERVEVQGTRCAVVFDRSQACSAEVIEALASVDFTARIAA